MSKTGNPNNELLRPVSAPLSKTRLSTLIYTLVLLSSLLTAYYGYRVVQWKAGSGSTIVPRSPPKATSSNGEYDSVEGRINALAEALGMPSQDLAKAIAGAVREYVPPASLSAVKERETGKGSLVLDELFKEREGVVVPAPAVTGSGVVEGVLSGVDSFVGMDEP